MAWTYLHRVLFAGALGLVLGLLVVACAPNVLRPAISVSRAFVHHVAAGPGFSIASAPKLAVPTATPTALLVLVEIPTPIAPPRKPSIAPTSAPTHTPLPRIPTPTPIPPTRPPADPTAIPTPTPTVSLEEFWARMRSYEYHSVLDQLPILAADRRIDPLFGINNALAAENATAPIMRGLGATLDRVEVRWDEIEPSPGEFQFDRLDRLIAAAERWNISVLAVVDGAPAWAVDRPERVGAGPPRALDQPALLPTGKANPANPWSYFLWTVATRYGNRISAWEIWNEPNFRDFWRGSPQDYALLFQVAHAALHQANPRTTVMLGGMVVDDGSFLSAVIQQICPIVPCPTPPFDAVAWHVYGNPTDVLRVAEQTRSILAPYQVAVPIWITEANVAVDDPEAPRPLVVGPDAVSLDQQAAFVLQLYALARAAGVHNVAIYRGQDVNEGRHWGLLRANLTARPALVAYRTAAEWISHTQFVQISHPVPLATRVELRRPGENISIIWTDSTTAVQIDVPTTATTGTLVQFTGTKSAVHAVGKAFRVPLPAAPPRRPATAPLALPVILVTPG